MEGGGGDGVRLHVGGLGESVGKDDLLKIFSPMGSVDSVEFVRTKGRSFAYIDFSPSSNNSLTKLFSTYNGCVWKGGRLRLEKAKEHYLARLKREWEEESSASDHTIQAPDNSTPSTHLNIFFPRLRKVKAMPLSGTGKHKYSFQRVTVSSSLPKSFCDCEEHSTSLTPRENHIRDLEALDVGINEQEVNIMNSVMNKLFQKNNIPNLEKVPEEDSEIEADQDNLVINVVSGGNSMRDSELDILTRKRKSTLNETTASEKGYTEGKKGNGIHPNKKQKSTTLEGNGRHESSQARRETKKPSEVDPEKSSDELSRTISGVKQSNDNVSWSQKSSWKSLIASGNSNTFSVSSFLPDDGSSKAVQPSPSTDLAEFPIVETSEDLDLPRPTVKTKIKKTKSKRLASTIVEVNLPVANDIEGNDTTGTDAVGSNHSETLADNVTETSVDAKPLELVASTEGNQCSANDEQNVQMDEDVTEEDLSAEKENLVLKDNVNHDVGVEEAGKGQLKACSKSTGGSSWLQKASWTQLVSDKDTTSFSITQLLPELNADKHEAARVVDSGDGQCSNSKQSESGTEQWGMGGFEAAAKEVHVDSTPVRSLEGNQQRLNGKNLSAGPRLVAKKPIMRNIGSSETCSFMRSSASLKEWAKAKKALSEPRRKKQSEE